MKGRSGCKAIGFRTTLFLYNMVMLLIVFLLALGLFIGLYRIVDDMQGRINKYVDINRVSQDLNASRSSYDELLTAVRDGKGNSLAPLVDSLRIPINKARGDAESLVVPYDENPDKYFLSRAIINGLEYLDDLVSPWRTLSSFSPEWYADFYNGQLVFHYLYQYANDSYLSAAVDNDIVAQVENMKMVGELRALSVVLTVVIALVYLFFTYILMLRLTRPVNEMVRTASDITQGDLETPDIDVSSPTELAFLAQSMNQMKASLKEQMALESRLHHKELEQVRMTRELDRARYLALQAQINPHFLFNTLNTISHTALFEHADATVGLINTLASILRYTLEFSDVVSLEKELVFVRQYLKIQHARFGDRIAWEISCPEECAVCLIPPLTVQPLVENAIVHGLEPLEEGGKVTVTVTKEPENRMRIVVEDNGVGYDERDRKKERGKDKGKSRVGITNINDRLVLFTDMQKPLTISRITDGGHGTRAVIVVPMHTPLDEEET